MCGRYVGPNERALQEEYGVVRCSPILKMQTTLAVDGRNYNVAPSQYTRVVRVIRTEHGARESLEMRWGLVPSWTKGELPKFSTINATLEKIESAPAWRGPWRRGQRCIMPCMGFYEWHVHSDGSKTPYFIEPTEPNSTFPFAALWDESINTAGEAILSCAVITLPANELMTEIHNVKQRMPAILDKADIDAWLGGTAEQAKAVLKPYPSELMHAYAVSTKVNSPKHNGPELIQPIAANE